MRTNYKKNHNKTTFFLQKKFYSTVFYNLPCFRTSNNEPPIGSLIYVNFKKKAILERNTYPWILFLHREKKFAEKQIHNESIKVL